MSDVALLGQGIGHSASPAIHDAAFAAVGLPHRYRLCDVAAADLPAAVARLRRPEWLGANVTRPHKVAVAAWLDGLEPDAERVGAVNTVVRRDGRLIGTNTDLPALRRSLDVLCGGVPPRRAVVLGRGGAARAVEVALGELGTVATLLGRDAWPSLPALLVKADLLVNATPIGTGSDESPVPRRLLRDDLRVLDLVYRPSPTRLVRDALAAGAPAIGGARMLLDQAALSFTLWTGLPAPREAMRAALREELGPVADV